MNARATTEVRVASGASNGHFGYRIYFESLARRYEVVILRKTHASAICGAQRLAATSKDEDKGIADLWDQNK